MKIECPHCKKEIEIGNEYYGQNISCPYCEGVMSVPYPQARLIEAEHARSVTITKIDLTSANMQNLIIRFWMSTLLIFAFPAVVIVLILIAVSKCF